MLEREREREYVLLNFLDQLWVHLDKLLKNNFFLNYFLVEFYFLEKVIYI